MEQSGGLFCSRIRIQVRRNLLAETIGTTIIKSRFGLDETEASYVYIDRAITNELVHVRACERKG